MTAANRKGFADQKLIVDNVAEGVRILREKADDTNVRLSTMSQELESLRTVVQTMPAPSAVPPSGVTSDPTDPNAPPGAGRGSARACSPRWASRTSRISGTA